MTDGTPPSLTDGTPPTLTDGTPPTLTDGTPPTLTDGTPPSLTDGTPPSLTDGTPPTLDPGTLPHFATVSEMKSGHKATHIAVEFNTGGVTPYLGHSTKKVNGAAGRTKTTHYGVRGGLGDTGLNFLVAAKSVQPASAVRKPRHG